MNKHLESSNLSGSVSSKINFQKELLKNTFWIYLFSYLAAPLGYIIKIIYARSFSLEEFGLFYSILGLYTLISLFTDFGFTETFKYYGVKFFEKKDYNKLKQLFYYSFIIQISITILFSLLIFIFNDFIFKYYFKLDILTNISLLLLLYFIGSNILRNLFTLLLIKQNYFLYQLGNFITLFMILIGTLLFLFIDKLDIKNISLLWGIVYFILIIIYIIVVQKNFKVFEDINFEFDSKFLIKIFKFALTIMIGSTAFLLIQRIDIQMITFFINLESVALYEIAISIANIFILILIPINTLILPLSKKMIENKEKEKLNQFITLLYKIFIYLSLPLLLIFIIFSREIILILFGFNYIQSDILLKILSIGFFSSLFFQFNFQILAAFKKIKQRNNILYLGGILNIVLNYILINSIGLIGAAITTTFVFSLMLFLTLIEIKKNIHLDLKLNYLIKVILGNFIFIFSIFLLKKIILLNIYLEIFIVISISSVIYIFYGLIIKLFTINQLLNFLNLKISKKLEFLKKY